MFGLFASSQLKELMLLCTQATEYYNKDFEIVLEASNKALELLPQVKSWRGAPPGMNHDTTYANLIIFRTGALSALYGTSQSDINKQIINDLEKAIKILEPTGKNDMWAYCCIDLSFAYFDSPHESHTENIEKAIQLATIAKKYYKVNISNENRYDHARCCANLANYYEKKGHIAEALANIHEARQIWTRENYYPLWAELKVREGLFLTKYDAPDRIERIETVKKEIVDLLNVFSRQKTPSYWILSREVLSRLFAESDVGNKADNIECAIKVIENDLVEDSSEYADYPMHREILCRQYFAIANLYTHRITGSSKENVTSALKFAYKAEKYCDESKLTQLYSIKSIIARCELSLYKIDPAKSSKEIEIKLIEAIELAEALSDEKSKAHCLGNLAEYYSLASDMGAERFDKALEIYAKIENMTRDIDPVFYHTSLMNKAITFSNKINGNFEENTAESLKNFQIAHNYFENGGFEDKLIQCKINMAETLIQMHLNGIVDRDQRAIALLEQAAQSEIVENNQQQKAEIAHLLSKAYSGRTSGDRTFNKINNKEMLQNARQNLDPEKDIELWIRSLEDEIQFSIDNNDVENLRSLEESFEKDVFTRIDPKNFPVPWAHAKIAYARVLRRTLADTADKYTTVIKLYEEAVEALEKSKDKNILDWAETKFGLARAYLWWHDHDSSADYNLAIRAYDEGLSVFTPESWPIRYFRIQLELGTLFVKKERWQKADDSFKKAINCVENHLDNGKDALRAQLLDHYSGWLLTLIPFVALKNGDIRRALNYSEKLKARSLKTALDIEEYLSQQVNEHSLRAKYKQIRLDEKLLETQADGNTHKTIDQLDYLRSELEFANQEDLLSSAHREFDLDECLAGLENWVLIPFVGHDHTILVLLPPNSTLADAKISELIPYGDKTLSSMLVEDPSGKDKDTLGWLTALQEYEEWKVISKHAKESPKISMSKQQNIENRFKQAAKLYEPKQLILDKFLWDHYGQWIVDTVNADDMDNPVHITIIPQTVLNAFSFAAASGQEDDFLLDYCEISYSPSLYAKIMLDRRAKNYTNPPHLAFIPYEKLECSPLEGKLSASNFQDSTIVDFDEQKELQTVNNKLSHSNYWHFALHGKFILSNPGDSYLILSGESEQEGSNHMFRLKILSALETDNPLRLVSLSACEVGMQDFLKTPNEPLGFPTSFIQIGAIGVIATLWSVSDKVAMLVMSRFYDYHIIENYKPAAALRLAQRWLIDSTTQDFINYLEEKVSEGILSSAETMPVLSDLKSKEFDKYLYTEPYYWASFVFYGA